LAAAKMAVGFVVNTTSFRAMGREHSLLKNAFDVAAGAFGFLTLIHVVD
jgi:hypothetical protein